MPGHKECFFYILTKKRWNMIRIARPADLSAVMEVIENAKELLRSQDSLQWQDGYPDRMTMTADIEANRLYVNDIDGVIAGIAALVPGPDESYAVIYEGSWPNDRPYYAIHRVAVKKGFYGRGVARELIEHLQRVVRVAGIVDLRADTALENAAMQGLLARCGFRQCGIIYLVRPTCRDPKRLAYHKILE